MADNATLSEGERQARFSSHFLARVTKTFPTVGFISNKAAVIYNTVKEANPILKNSLETAENKINNYQHLLEKVDDLGVRGFQTVEDIAHNPIDTLKSTAVPVLSQAKTIFSEKIVAPTRTVLSNQIDRAITLSEQTVDKYVQKEEAEDKEVVPSKAIRVQQITTRVSKHLKNKAINSIKNAPLKKRTQEQIEQLKTHSVDLIKYYQENLAQKRDVVVKKAKETALNQVTKAKEIAINKATKARDTAYQLANTAQGKLTEAKAAAQEKASIAKKRITNTIKERVQDKASLAYEIVSTNHYVRAASQIALPYATIAYNFCPNFPYRSTLEAYVKTSLTSAQLYLARPTREIPTTTNDEVFEPKEEVKEIPTQTAQPKPEITKIEEPVQPVVIAPESVTVEASVATKEPVAEVVSEEEIDATNEEEKEEEAEEEEQEEEEEEF